MTPPTVPTPTSVWTEPQLSSAALPAARAFWQYNVSTGEWTLTTDAMLENGRFADLTGTGTFELTLLSSIPPGTPVLKAGTLNSADTTLY